jgi:D-alanine-D-alanine ligase
MGDNVNRVAVLMGGVSMEREGSLQNGKECAQDLRDSYYDVIEIDVDYDVVDRLRDAKPDVVFNGCYGRWVEDGAIQGLLEWMKLPYTHSGVVASAIAMDKARCRDVFSANGLPVAEGRLISRKHLGSVHPMASPYVLKPNSEGSSLGTWFVLSDDTLPPSPSLDLPNTFLVEKFVPGRDLSVGVVRDKAMVVTEIVSENGVWDLQAKQGDVMIEKVTPARLPKAVTARCLELAETAHRSIGCRFISRTDIRWDESNGIDGLVVLEINTQPAFFKGSLFEKQLFQQKISRSQLCRWLVEDASLDR